MDYETLEYETVEDGIGILSLNRPRRYNTVNAKMAEELEAFWRERLYDLDTHVIILRGNGNKHFCAGLDMKAVMKIMPGMDTDMFYRFQARLARLNLAMRQAPQPVICAVHGAAVGLGFSFALASDVRIISDDSRFSAAYINIGLGGADMACSYFLPRLMGAGRAYEFMLTGNFMSAEDALSLGLASRVVARDQLMDTALELARTMNGKNPMGLRLTKEAINMNIDAGGLEQALNMEDRNQTLLVLRGKLGQKTGRYF
ncbi:MAG: enoyl-CoA hydratase/isomerase family protein [Deltaproteobacteria bacterium]|nr:enoyl-CoA hydratase/isomerase family protein [Deltaproteobacteria bacterium]MBW2049601.1 enoyl-CoA hydratase/isomerase family protein [Deltaproteobacteria bacterium]MBW2111023.1 enoyl-CoA hydratase/isomerase family protein [Deltaproteobacteria bacterium]MBW2352003.1 enoyl-CoA hydratase/isomerase family protein [Deltaproteobacteria bacterium]HDZ91728.1 enoyl-CoA hydratase/isomerase family protein [Deltaproteobacteria bacterium]